MLNYVERALRYQRIHGTKNLLREVLLRVKRRLSRRAATPVADRTLEDADWDSALAIVRHHPRGVAPLRLFTVPATEIGRVTLILDHMGATADDSPVTHALIVAALLAHLRGERLRVVTRGIPPQPRVLHDVLERRGLRLADEVEFAHAPPQDERYELSCWPGELFVTTSWLTTRAALGSVAADSILYLVQEDERLLVPHGDEHLMCSRVLANASLRFLVSTRRLFDALVADGVPHLTERGLWFEPAFEHGGAATSTDKRTLLFHAGACSPHELFYLGLQVLDKGIRGKAIDLAQWEIAVAGDDIPALRLGEPGYSPRRIGAAEPQHADVALSMLASPHPGHATLRLGSGGSVVVTNRFGTKKSLSEYGPNYLCVEPEVGAMLDALNEAMQMARPPATPSRGDWQSALAPVLGAYAPAA